jgi:hypothetical protein
MNYIPGFSNYLRTSVPRYARGGEVMEDMEFSDYGLGGPMMGAETVGFDLANPMLGGPEQGGSYTGGMGGGPSRTEEERAAAILDVNPYVAPSADMNLDPITSQRSGGQTGYYFANELGLPARFGDVGLPQPANPATFDPNAQYVAPTPGFVPVDPNATYRLVEGGTDGNVVYAGEGGEGLRNVFEQANNLTLDDPKNAYWGVEVLDPATGQYKRVAENQGPNGLGIVGDIAGVALPVAAAIATGGASLGVQIAAGAAAGGLGGFLAGNDPLKGAVMGGLSVAGGKILGPALEAGGKLGTALAPRLATAVGTGIGSTVGGIATGQSLENSLLGGVASGGLSYLTPDISKGLKDLGMGPGGTPTTSGGGGFDGILVNATPAVTPINLNTSLGGSPNKIQQALKPNTETPYDGLTVTGGKFGTVGFGGDQFGAPGQDTSAFEKMYSEPYDPNEILVKASPLEQAAPVSVPVTSGLSPDVQAGIAEFEKNPIVAEGSKIEQPTSVGPLNLDLGVIDRMSDMENYKEPIVVEGSKIERPEPVSVSVVPPLDPLPPLDLKPDPALTDKKKLGLEEYLRIADLLSGLVGGAAGGNQGQTGTYGGGGTGRLNPIFSAKLPSAGGLGTIGANRTVRPMGDVDWLTYGTRPELNFYDYAARPNPAPITTPIPNNPAGPIMAERDPMAMAKGGRTEFAVNGPGTGRSDDIPAVLSDGEYVIDAETVALLGDGSSKAGAKKLDDLRVKVRKHKGQKLAKGRFSANAKKPEAYLSGGRI